MTNEQRHIYIARFRYGEAELAKYLVEKETPKTFTVAGGCDNIVGSTPVYTTRIIKSEIPCFDLEIEALGYLYVQAIEYVRQCQVETSKARSRAAALEQMIGEQVGAN